MINFPPSDRLSLAEIERIVNALPTLECNPDQLGETLSFSPHEIQHLKQQRTPSIAVVLVTEWQERSECHTRQCLAKHLLRMGHYCEALWLDPKCKEVTNTVVGKVSTHAAHITI